METPDADLGSLRQQAKKLVIDVLRRGYGRSQEELANDIIALADGEDNAVKEFFVRSNLPDRGRTSTPASTPKSRRSRSILRLGRCSKSSISDGKTATSHQAEVKSLAPTSRSNSRSTAKSGLFTSAPKTTKGAFQCIICGEFLSSKGVCKRHLEDQHVSPKEYKCEMCARVFTMKSKCKEHIKACGKGILMYVVVKKEEKRVYACEFTGHVFSSMTRYLEHLLALCEKTNERPKGDHHRKLYALLDRPVVLPRVEEVSQRLYGHPDAWRRLQWRSSILLQAIEKLEYATIRDERTLEFGKHVDEKNRMQDIEVYMYSLLSEAKARPSSRGTLRSVSKSRDELLLRRSSAMSMRSNGTIKPPTPGPRTSVAQTPQLVQSYQWHTALAHNLAASDTGASRVPVPTDGGAYYQNQDLKSKRHLSDHSRFYEPVRNPPGPPLPTHMPQLYDLRLHDSHSPTPIDYYSTSLPYRQPDVATLANTPDLDHISPHHHYTSSLETTSSDSAHALGNYTPSLTTKRFDASRESTMISTYREYGTSNASTLDYGTWPVPPGALGYSVPSYNNGVSTPLVSSYDYSGAGESSRTASFATDQTYVVDFLGNDQKTLTTVTHDMASFGTFLLDDEEGNDGHLM